MLRPRASRRAASRGWCEQQVAEGLDTAGRASGVLTATSGDTSSPWDNRCRQPGDADGLGEWLEGAAASADAVIASLDMLCYGGLIAARTTADTTLAALRRLDVLRRLHAANPQLPLCAVSLVMRASNAYNAQEEPEYWAQFGMELRKRGTLHHRDLGSDPSAAVASRLETRLQPAGPHSIACRAPALPPGA